MHIIDILLKVIDFVCLVLLILICFCSSDGLVHGLKVPLCSFDGAELEKMFFGNETWLKRHVSFNFLNLNRIHLRLSF